MIFIDGPIGLLEGFLAFAGNRINPSGSSLDTSKYEIHYDGKVLFVRWKEIIVDLLAAQQVAKDAARLTANSEHFALIDLSKIRSMQRDARKFFAQNGNRERCKAVALLMTSPTAQVIGNFFFGIQGPSKAPTRIFLSEPEALAWLRSLQG